MSENPNVFISYSHQDSEYEEKVLKLANKLRGEGIDAEIDLYESAPSEGWPRWMEKKIDIADFVLIICGKSYYDKCYSETKGKGVSWESNIIYQKIYDNNSENTKFIPVIFNNNDIQYILTPLKSFTYYNIDDATDYEKLYWRLRGVTQTQKPPLGKLRPLFEKTQKSMFISSPIDIEKWNAAGWTGALYLFHPDRCPVVGLIYKDYVAAKSIFIEWKENAENSYADAFLKVDYIVPPFPKNCWVCSGSDWNYGVGYFIHIGPNIKQSTQRAYSSGIKPNELVLAAISRFQWMNERSGTHNRDMFQKYIDNESDYLLMPIGIRNNAKPVTDENLIVDFSYAIKMRNCTFRAGANIKDDDLCKAVLLGTNE